MKHAFKTNLMLPQSIKSKTLPQIRKSFLVQTTIAIITISTEKQRLRVSSGSGKKLCQ